MITMDIELLLKRIARKAAYTIGKLYINGVYFCDTLEDVDRGLSSDMSLDEIKKKKVPHVTAVPTGTYEVTLAVKSPRFGSRVYYKNLCDGKLPRLIGVPGYEGVLFHVGNTAKDTDGCILLGQNKVVGQVINSRAVYTKFYNKIKGASSIKLTIK